MNPDPLEHFAADRAEVEKRLREMIAAAEGTPDRLRRAMAHSLFGGGKRLRPLLLLASRDAWARGRRGASRRTALDAGCAVEMLHTYSLIHDDLPAMDDDVLRRGRPTCHVAFDEATAILAGDALQALAFGVLAGCGRRGADLAALLADAAGPAGMVGGQQLDLDSEGTEPDAELIRRIHLGKTAMLIAAPLAAGAMLADAAEADVEQVRRAGLKLGLAFQAADDVLDVMASAADLGKTPGKDAAAGKITWISLEGLDAARARARRYGDEGTRLLRRLLPPGEPSDRLLALSRMLWDRTR